MHYITEKQRKEDIDEKGCSSKVSIMEKTIKVEKMYIKLFISFTFSPNISNMCQLLHVIRHM